MKNFRDKVVVITGAGSGIGKGLAIEFAREGAVLALNDCNATELEKTVEIIRKMGNKIFTKIFDVSKKKDMLLFANEVQVQLGGADVVINNAGITSASISVNKLDSELLEQVMNVNFWGVVHGTKAFLPQLLSKPEGVIMNVASSYSFIGHGYFSPYCASKFAVRGFTESLMCELWGSNVTVHCLHPGGIATNIAMSAIGPSDENELRLFEKLFLKTPPDIFAKKVIKSIKKKEMRIIFGHQSIMPNYVLPRLFPLSFFVKSFKKEFKKFGFNFID